MDETYKAAAEFAQTWGLAYFVVIFLGVLFYALWGCKVTNPQAPEQLQRGADA